MVTVACALIVAGELRWEKAYVVYTMVSLVIVFGTLRAWGLYTEIKNEVVRNPCASLSLEE